jgi:hypothetical protein
MSDPERLTAYLVDFGERLTAAAATSPSRRRPRLLLMGLAAAGVAAVIVAVALGATSDRLDPVAEARAALASPGEIIYMKITSTTTSTTSGTVPAPRTTEQWSAVNPLRWRYVQSIPHASAREGAMGDSRGPIFGRMELSYGHGVLRDYLAERNSLTVTTGYRDDELDARMPSLLGQGSGDPQGDLRSMLSDAEVSDEGEQRVGGKTVRRFVSVRQRSSTQSRLRLVLDVDPATFAPLQGSVSLSFNGEDARVVDHLHVDEYRRIPLNDRTERLLEIDTAPGTKVRGDCLQALRERVNRWKAKCRPLKNGNLACPPPDATPIVP